MIAKVIAANNAGSRLASNISAADTSLTLTAGEGSVFASPTGGNYGVITISDQGTGNIREVIWYTGRTGDTLTGLQRGKEGTTARAWAVYDPVEELWTAGMMAKMAQDPSDQLGGVAAVQTYAGNPNGSVAGNAATVGGLPPSLVWDTTNKIFWTCTTTGSTSTAAWYPSSVPGQTVYAATVGGTANAITLTTLLPVTLTAGLRVAFNVGATNSGATTVALNGGAAVSVRRNSVSGPVALVGGEFTLQNTAVIQYDGALWHLENPSSGTAAKQNASSNTGTVAAISGALTVGHVAIFLDTAGTLTDGGPAGAPIGLNTGNSGSVLPPGRYLVDTSAGAVSATIYASPNNQDSWQFIDQKGTFATNNFTLNAPSGKDFVVNGTTFQTLTADLSGWEFLVTYNGTNFGME